MPKHDDLGFVEDDLGFVPEDESPGIGESALRGAAQGATLGFVDEAAGALGAGIEAFKRGSISRSDLVKDYIANRDKYRSGDTAASKANPWAYGAGEFGGGAATALVPFLNVGKAATLAGRAAGGARLGALAGIGNSTSDLTNHEYAGVVGDAAIGGALGGSFAPALEKVVAPVASAASKVPGWLGKKVMNTGFDVPEEVAERYLRNPEAVNKANSPKQMGQRLATTLSEIKEDAGPLHEAAMSRLSNVREANKGFELHSVLEKLRALDDKEAQKLADRFEQEYQKRLSGGLVGTPAKNPGYLTERELRDAKATLQAAADDWKSANPAKELADARAASGSLNATLKTGNPQYKEMQDLVEENTAAKKGLAKKFALEADFSHDRQAPYKPTDRTIPAFRDVYKENKFERADLLENIRKQGYGNLVDDIENTLAKGVLEGGGHPNGSRKVQMFKAGGIGTGAAIGSAMFGPVGGAVGSGIGYTLGGIAGGAMDKYGPRVAKKGMDASIAIRRLSRNPTLQKFVAPIQQAATRGQASVATTLFLLQQSEPDVNKALNDPEGDDY